MKIKDAMKLITTEYVQATGSHGTIYSSHEAYAIIKEELEEYWDCVKHREGGGAKAQKELIQIGAMALRALVDTTDMRHT
jgi:hypothetical protein